MKQLHSSFLKSYHQLNPPPSYHIPSSKTKPKHNVSTVASRSFSGSFLNQYSNKKSTKHQNQESNKRDQNLTRSQDSKSKKLSENCIPLNHITQKKKALLSVYDSKMLKQAIKAKSQSQNLNTSSYSNFKYATTDKDKANQIKQKNYLRLSPHTKNKSQASFNHSYNFVQNDQKRLQTLSTTKNQEFKNKVIGHLQNKSRKSQNHNNVSLSERKKVSQKIEQKINQFQSAQDQSYAQNRKYISERATNEESIKKLINQRSQSQLKQKLPRDERLQYSYAFRTKKGKNISNPHKPNQDSILVKQNIGKKDLHMIAVADGHGQSGHYVSQFIVKSLSKLFSDEINEISKYEQQGRKDLNSQVVEGTLFLPKIYDKIQNDLSCSQINSASSGSTLVNVIIQKKQVLCANVGDSRAILARQLDKKNWELIYLSQDHKPSSQNQRKRILKNGGRIHSFKGERGQNLGPLRVWLPNQNIQGLAMTRSFGDNISKTVGVTHKPEMIKVKIDEKDKFILVASDGVWEFIENQQILQLIVPFYKEKRLQEACDALLKLAYEKWTVQDDSVVDDISFVLVFLHC